LPTTRIRLWNRLGFRLGVAIACMSIATLGVFLALTLRSQRRHLLEQARRSAAVVSDTITSSIHIDMLHDNREDAYEIMDVIAAQDHVDRLRVFDVNGRIRYSADRREVGQTPGLQSESCVPCHKSPDPMLAHVRDRTRITTRNGRQVLGAVTPIYNGPSCSAAACHVHPPSQRIVGVVELGLTLDNIETEMATLRGSTIGLAAFAALVLGVFTFAIIRRLVAQPVSELILETRRVRQGELDERPHVVRRDELGVLETSFNEMERGLAAAQAERDRLLDDLERQVAERTAALETAQQRLIQTEKLSSLGRLSASIAHEINNPLSGILTTAKLVKRTLQEGELSERARARIARQLELVQRETERCTAIVRNLLGFARERPLTVTDTDVNAALEEALFLITNQVALQNVRLVKKLNPLPSVHADFGQLRQAFANILINACDAMPSGGTLTVETGMLDAQSIEIRLEDTGVGIPRDQMTKVLDPFFTTKEKGTGLGLSVVYGIVERHGGKLQIESEVGVGTTVLIRLPVASADAPARIGEAALAAAPAEAARSGS
jgi:two-component system NtrC family sensor kinase